jgi:hypothetical protein
MAALMFVGGALMFDPGKDANHVSKGNIFCLSGYGKQYLLFVLLISCCMASNLQNFIGLFPIVWTVSLLVYGYGDTRYVAKKFAASHFLALVLCACANMLYKSAGWCACTIILHLLGFGLLTPVYPLGSWIDSFFHGHHHYF